MECRVVKKPREPKGVRNKKTLSPLEAKLLHDALYDMIYRVLMGDKLTQHRSESDVIAVENILKDIDLGE